VLTFSVTSVGFPVNDIVVSDLLPEESGSGGESRLVARSSTERGRDHERSKFSAEQIAGRTPTIVVYGEQLGYVPDSVELERLVVAARARSRKR
jgi:hypothetical protein